MTLVSIGKMRKEPIACFLIQLFCEKACLEVHRQKTLERASKSSVLLAIQDTSYIDYSSHKSKTDMDVVNRIGTTEKTGIILHTTYLVGDNCVPIGILSQEYCSRPELVDRQGKSKAWHNLSLPIEQKESMRWIRNMEDCSNLSPRADSVIQICDREADIIEFQLACQRKNQRVVIRAKETRLLQIGKTKRAVQRLDQFLEEIPSTGEMVVNLKNGKNDEDRQARMAIKYSSISLRPKVHRCKNSEYQVDEPIKLMVIEACEIDCHQASKTAEFGV